ncbi:MAG: hypothetical protein OEZ29_03000 [Candidatus Bathyarchaeota archaeon]|nr:hypothetical protein [Candidatus Bathyarchaeota archaeon]MDH5779544.1 hypothetical protein [Candidatus Bathyarchaeota archaeon]
MLIKKISRIIFNKRAMNNAVSATIMTSVVIALGLSVFTWAQARSSDYNSEFSETVDTETAKLKEKLAFEYIFYDGQNLTVFLLNCGTIDDVKIKTVYIYDRYNNLKEIFSDPLLYSFHDWEKIPDQNLDIQDEGRLVLPPSSSLSGFYNIKIVTVRGATFDTDFVA